MLDQEVSLRATEAGLVAVGFAVNNVKCIAMYGPEEFVVAVANDARDEVAAAIDWLRYGRFEREDNGESANVVF